MNPDITLLAAEAMTRTSTAEAISFWVFGAIAVAGAIGVVAAPKAVYAAMFLATTMISLAAIYMAQDAPFLGVVQIVVYTGAVMMLFLFVLMLIGVDSAQSLVETIRGQRFAGIAAGFACDAVLINQQAFTKTANIWGVGNNTLGTNSNRIVVFKK